MTIDVLFPFYGDVGRMRTAVRSVLDQHYEDFRLIVIDDGYPDDSVPGWFAGLSDPRVVYERNTVNLGLNGNFRKALSYATNPLMTIMGCDDVMLPHHLSWLAAAAEAHPEAQIFQPGVFVIDDRGAPSRTLTEQIKDVIRGKGQGQRVLKGEDLAVSLLRGNWLYFPSIGWRTETAQAVGFHPGLNTILDLALVLDIVMAGGSLLTDDIATFCYRRHRDSFSSAHAVQGDRFDEDRRYFTEVARQLDKLGWKKAARAARWHITGRLHAATVIPAAIKQGDIASVKRLAFHLVG
ncbi:MAG: glycosyltransferase [Propionibacteriaceae bacterium]|jgi:glycosyltransferase involved in cell wall biosynthesis|nr:glycosyltransferase [Propionibacteriaceae bacterium]